MFIAILALPIFIWQSHHGKTSHICQLIYRKTTIKKAAPKIPKLYERIAEACQAKNARQVAEKLGLDPSSVYAWEKQKSQPELSRLIEISQQTGYSIHYLLTGEGERLIQKVDDEDLDKVMARISTLIPRADEETQRVVRQNLLMWEKHLQTRLRQDTEPSTRKRL